MHGGEALVRAHVKAVHGLDVADDHDCKPVPDGNQGKYGGYTEDGDALEFGSGYTDNPSLHAQGDHDTDDQKKSQSIGGDSVGFVLRVVVRGVIHEDAVRVPEVTGQVTALKYRTDDVEDETEGVHAEDP